MVDISKAIVSRLKIHGENFEILVDPDLVLSYKSGGGDKIPLEKILAVQEIFKDAKAGERASEERMKELFKTSDVLKVAEEILEKGEFSLTTEQRRKLLEDKKKQIISIIARNAIDPKTNLPHPPIRIERAMEEAKVFIDMKKSAEEQIESVLKEIRPLIPIKFATLKVAIKIPAKFYGNVYKIFREFGKVQKEEWQNENYFCLIEIPAGLRDQFYNSLNNLTHGEVSIKNL